VTTCSGWLCPENHLNYVSDILTKGVPPPLERDCGPWCSAFTYVDKTLPMVRMTFPNYNANIALVYDASPEVWQKMMCSATTDSSATTRACCACYDERFCPFPPGGKISTTDSGYCNGGHCADDEETCKQLAAGCGVSTWAASDEGQWGQCTEESIGTGQCNMCTQPLWCDDGDNTFGYGSAIKTGQQWWDRFGYNDGGDNWGGNGGWTRQFFGAKQCLWKRDQKEQFRDSIRIAMRNYQEQGYSRSEPGMWNEVNIYYGPDDHDTEAVMWRNLLGILYIRGGNGDDEQNVGRLRDHWREHGSEVPLFIMNMENWGELDHWKFDEDTNLDAEEWDLDNYVP